MAEPLLQSMPPWESINYCDIMRHHATSCSIMENHREPKFSEQHFANTSPLPRGAALPLQGGASPPCHRRLQVYCLKLIADLVWFSDTINAFERQSMDPKWRFLVMFLDPLGPGKSTLLLQTCVLFLAEPLFLFEAEPLLLLQSKSLFLMATGSRI